MSNKPGERSDRTPAKREVHVLMGVNEPVIAELISEIIRGSAVGDCVFQFTEIAGSEQLLQVADEDKFDLFVLLLNNLLHPEETSSPEDRMKRSLQLVSRLRRKSGKPVIALSGWLETSSLDLKAKEAGAAFFFSLPFDPRQFGDAVAQCLRTN